MAVKIKLLHRSAARCCKFLLFSVALRPNAGHGPLILEVSRSHKTTYHSGRTPLDEWSARRRDLYLTKHNTYNRQISIPRVEFEPTISAGERQQTYALDRAACGRSPTEIVSSNPTGGMDICLLWGSCVVRWRSLRRAEHSSRRVLPTVLRRCVWSRNIKNRCSICIWH
jgi:hypothetical protein